MANHPAVSRVNYPGLASHPDHARAKGLFTGFGGTLSFDLAGGADAAERFIAALHQPIMAPSLGGVDSLVMLPAQISHAGLSEQERHALGIGDGLVRLSVGVESVEDLIEDLQQALGIAVPAETLVT